MSGINDSSTPAEFPNNPWTQMIEAVAARNKQGAPMPPEQGVPHVGTPMPTVRSAELGRPVPLTTQEIEELNQAALKSGLVVGPVNPSMAQTLDGSGASDDGTPYATLAEAIAAGAPVGADADAIADAAMRFSETMPTSPTIRVRPPIGSRQTAREFIASQPASQLPRLPDFKKVQMIDVVNGKVYVDGLEFSLTTAETKMLRKICIEKAKEQIQASLEAALKALAEDADGGTEAV